MKKMLLILVLCITHVHLPFNGFSADERKTIVVQKTIVQTATEDTDLKPFVPFLLIR